MFMWDESTPKILSASPTNQLKVSLGVRAATLCTIEVFTKSSHWASPNIGMITVRGKCHEHANSLLVSLGFAKRFVT